MNVLFNTKLNYKDFYDKLDPELFLDTIEYISFNDFKMFISLFYNDIG